MNLRRLLPVVNVLVTPLWWIVMVGKIVSEGLPSAKPGTKRVLLVTHNELMARYLREVADLIREERDISLRVARAPFADSAVPLSEIVNRLEVPPIPFWRSLIRWWDLIVFADHYPASLFHPGIRKLFVSHGLFSGVILGGSNYIYGARAVRRNGMPMFARMLASGPAERACALRINPVLEDAVAIVGAPTVDRLMKRNERREEIRERLGIAPSDCLVMIMSSWGEDSLAETTGPSLVAAAQELTDRYQFVLTIHPNNYTRGGGDVDWSAFMAEQEGPRFRIIGPYDSWDDHLIAADIAIADRTSLALYFNQLHRPILFIPLDMRRFVAGAPLALLYEISPKLGKANDLEVALQRALSEYPLDRARELAADLVAFPGEAEERMRRVALDLLNSTATRA